MTQPLQSSSSSSGESSASAATRTTDLQAPSQQPLQSASSPFGDSRALAATRITDLQAPSHFPKDIYLDICDALSNQPRVVDIWSLPSNNPLGVNPPALFASHSYPPLLSTCSASRTLALKKYVPYVPNAPTAKVGFRYPIFVNWKSDILCPMTPSLEDNRDLFFQYQDPLLQTMALDANLFYVEIMLHKSFIDFLSQHSRLSLRELILYVRPLAKTSNANSNLYKRLAPHVDYPRKSVSFDLVELGKGKKQLRKSLIELGCEKYQVPFMAHRLTSSRTRVRMLQQLNVASSTPDAPARRLNIRFMGMKVTVNGDPIPLPGHGSAP